LSKDPDHEEYIALELVSTYEHEARQQLL